jgi:hypothetical protein
VASLKSDEQGYCWNHSPSARAQRAAARARGGHAKARAIAERKARAPAPSRPRSEPTPSGAPFDVGELRDVSEIAAASRALARAVADGSMPVGRGRLLAEILGRAHAAVLDATGGMLAHEGREATDQELEYIRLNRGHAPPGVKILAGPFRVEGDVYTGPPEPVREEAPEPEATNIIPFPISGTGPTAA